jgi:hypothetical protein
VRRHAGAEPAHVIVVADVEAPARHGWIAHRRRGPRHVAPEPEPSTVTIARVTIIDADPLPDRAAAEAWLRGLDAEVVLPRAVALLNRVIAGHRLGAADPYVRERTAAEALVCRAGYGPGEAVAEGRWEAAVELPAPRPGARSALLAPQQRLADLLGGRDAALACEELALRARLDVEQGRPREAALQLRGALDAALAELAAFAGLGGVATRLADLRERHAGAVAAAAEAALAGALEPADERAVADALDALERVLRARLVG